jgi:hypothetical protein
VETLHLIAWLHFKHCQDPSGAPTVRRIVGIERLDAVRH